MSSSDQALILAGLAGLCAILIWAAILVSRRERRVKERRKRIVQYAGTEVTQKESNHRYRSGSRTFMTSLLLRLRVRALIVRGLDGAGSAMAPETFAALIILAFMTLWFVFGTLLSSVVAGLALGLAISVIVPVLILSRIGTKRRQEFEAELPEFFLLVASALRSGLSFGQALDAVAQEGDSELSRQMRRAALELSLGLTPSEVLSDVAERMKSEEMKWAVVAISVQRDVGGHLSEILDSIADTVRTRAEINREVRSLSAEGRLSAIFLIAMPIVIFVILLVLRPDYVEVLWSTTPGQVMLVASFALFAVGVVWLRSLIRVRI